MFEDEFVESQDHNDATESSQDIDEVTEYIQMRSDNQLTCSSEAELDILKFWHQGEKTVSQIAEDSLRNFKYTCLKCQQRESI